MLLLPFTQFLFGPLPWLGVQENQMVLNVLLTPAFEKGKETFEKVLFLTERGSQQITDLPSADAPDDTISTRITEFHIAVIYLHFSTVSFWIDDAKQNKTV